MKTKQIVFIALLLLAIGGFIFSGNFKSDPIQPRKAPQMAKQEKHNHPPTSLLPTVTEVTLAVKTTKGELLNSITLKVGEVKALADAPYQLSVKEFHSHWNYDGGPINISFGEVNPAIKVDVLANDSLLFYQWAFKNMPFFGEEGSAHQMTKSDSKDLVFTLLEYKGFKIPGGGS